MTLPGDEPTTLDNCAREPIHIPGAVQPHGVLFACHGPELRIAQVSSSVTAHLALAPDAVLGTSLADWFEPASAARLLALTAQSGDELRALNPHDVMTRAGVTFDAVVHRGGPGLLLVELEPRATGAAPAAGFDPALRTAVLRFQRARDIDALCTLAAEHVRAITGFDRVMVYRFDPEWNGKVVAEDRRPDLESYLGQHYPASDIPEQARRLYTLNWLRLIADVAYTPSPLVPPFDPHTSTPLDLSHAVLRSVSPIHIQYLKNMGVSASMSISLLVEGELAGLIACHHYSGPKIVPFRIRDTAEYLGQALSSQLRTLELAAMAERTRVVTVAESEVMRSVAATPELLDGLAVPALLQLVDASGVAVVLHEGTRIVGDCPEAQVLAALVPWLRAMPSDVFVTANATHDVPALAGSAFGGLLAVAISRELGEYLVWFRPTTERTIDWGGNPAKPASATGYERLTPRGSFEVWREVVRGQALPWERWHVDAASNLRKALLGGVRVRAATLHDFNQRLIDADRAKDDFIATVSHELRTPLNSIHGWTQLLQSGRLDPDKLAHGLEVIARNTKAQVQIVDDLLDVSRMVGGKLTLEVEQVDIVAIVIEAVDAFEVALAAKDIRLKRVVDPTATPVLGDAARLRQIIANLVSNAIKFTPKGGSITVVLRRAESDIELIVSDTGIGITPDLMPLVFDMFRQGDSGMNRRSRGLGIGLAIVRKLVELHGGRITASSDGADKGSQFAVRIPMAPVLAKPRDPTPPREYPALRLASVTCLVVEDEPDARELVKHVLTSQGATVILAEDVATARRLLLSQRCDVLISDIGMPGADGYELIHWLRDAAGSLNQHTPAIALTAFSRAHDRTTALHAGFNAHVPKPVDMQELATVVASLTGRLVRPTR